MFACKSWSCLFHIYLDLVCSTFISPFFSSSQQIKYSIFLWCIFLLKFIVTVLVSCMCCNKLSQSWWLKTIEFILSQLWRPGVCNQFHCAEVKVWWVLALFEGRGEFILCRFQLPSASPTAATPGSLPPWSHGLSYSVHEISPHFSTVEFRAHSDNQDSSYYY